MSLAHKIIIVTLSDVGNNSNREIVLLLNAYTGACTALQDHGGGGGS